MELLNYPRTEYLLDASLESLHAESQVWLKEIEFWSDELAFFYKLLRRKEIASDFPTATLAEIEKELIRINSEGLDHIRPLLQTHDRRLADILSTTSSREEENFRSDHRKLLAEILEIQRRIKSFKKTVFDYIKKY